MDSKKSLHIKIFASTQIDQKDEWEDRHERCRSMLASIMADKSPKEMHDALLSAVSKDPTSHEDICIGFTVAILTSGPPGTPECVEMSTRYFRDLMLVARDSLQCVYRHMVDLALDKYPKLLIGAKQQLLWLTREMVQHQVQGMDQICWNLMRQIAGGDTSPNNLWLADTLLEIFIKHRQWLDKFPYLIASVVYTYLRLIEDHFHPPFEKLREREVKFVVTLLRERFSEVTNIGRDLARVLQNIARIPEIEAVWKDIIYNPKLLSPTFGGLVPLMQMRTSRRYLQSRITPEMEKKLVFLTSQV
jgi:integrator complex subunit 3